MYDQLATTNTDPRVFSGGQWLKNYEAQCSACYIEFDFNSLCNKVIQNCPGASSTAHREKKEGGSSRVSLLTTDNGQRLVAKLPTSLVGPRAMVTKSEVATMAYSNLTHLMR